MALLCTLAALPFALLTIQDTGLGRSSANGGVTVTSTIVIRVSSASPLADDGQRVVCTAYAPSGTGPFPPNTQFVTIDAMNCASCEAVVSGGTGQVQVTVSRDTGGNVLSPSTLYRVVCNDDPAGTSAGGVSGVQGDVLTAAAPTLVISSNAAVTTSRQLGVAVVASGLEAGQQVACAAQRVGSTTGIGTTFGTLSAVLGCPSLIGAVCVATASGGVVTDANGVQSMIIARDTDGAVIAGGTDYEIVCRDGPGSTALAPDSALATHARLRSRDDCIFNTLTVTVGSQPLTGADILVFGVTATQVGGGTDCVAGGVVRAGSAGCMLSMPGFQSATQSCNSDGQWVTAVLVAESCTIATVPHSDRGTPLGLVGVTMDEVLVTCDGGRSCSSSTTVPKGRTCVVVCAPAGVFQTSLAQPGLPSCDLDCPVAAVGGAAVRPAGASPCVEGGTVSAGTACEWTADEGYECSNLGSAVCGAPTAGVLGAGAPECQEKLCTTYPFPPGVAGGAVPPSCSTTTKLSALSNSRCSLACDAAAGYVGVGGVSTGHLSCPLSGGAPSVTLSCQARQCGVFDFAANGVLPLGSTAACDAIDETSTPCALTCDAAAGRVAGGTGSPLLSCESSAGTPTWTLTRPCLGPATCGASAYNCPAGYFARSDAVCGVVAVIAGSAVCVQSTTNDQRCCPSANAAPCPAFSSGAGSCVCDAGYSGTPTWDGSRWTHTCTEVQCPSVTFLDGWVGSGTSPCSPADPLGAAVDNACSVTCADGYATQGARLTCSTGGVLSAPQPATFSCVENSCRPYLLPPGTLGGSSGTPCSNGVVLSPVTAPSCTVQCATGYTSGEGIVTCSADLPPGSLPTGGVVCSELRCAPYTMPEGVTTHPADGCFDGVELSAVTDPSCNVQCVAGWSPLPNTNNPYPVRCNPSSPGAAPEGGVLCTRTCALHSCPVGYVPRTDGVPESFVCINSLCSDAFCCVPKDCPQYASVPGTCACNTGYRVAGGGGPVWSAALGGGSWTHACLPTCANPNFGGCDTGFSLVEDAGNLFCTGAGVCDASTCTACLQSQCCLPNQCIPPGTQPTGFAIAGGASCATTTACGAIGCGRGYVGTPQLECPVTGGSFQLQGCSPAACPPRGSGVGVCACEAGFMVSGGGDPVWNAVQGRWTHRCVPSCTNTNFTGCNEQGVTLKPSAHTLECIGGVCSRQQCCLALCSSTALCTASGLLPRSGFADLTCAGHRPGDCSVSQCCNASCAHPQFLGCGAFGLRPRADAAGVRCGGELPSSCSAGVCCEVVHCAAYSCPFGTSPRDGAGDCGGLCSAQLCCRENLCAPPGDAYPGYVLQGGAGCTSVSGCGAVQCEAGAYHIVYNATSAVPCTLGPVTHGTSHVPCTLGSATAGGLALADVVVSLDGPRLLCPTHGGYFVAAGCAQNECEPPEDDDEYAAYIVGGARTCNTVSSCGVVTCPPGHIADSPSFTCPEHQGRFTASGCREFTCYLLPSIEFAGYTLAGQCTPGGAGTLTQCGAVSCSPGYTPTAGVPALTCNGDMRNFTAHGCSENTCVQPGNPRSVPGYLIPSPSCTRTRDCGTVSCGTGYVPLATEQPRLICLVSGGLFTGLGCDPVPCPPGGIGDGVCACGVGYTGSPVWSGNTWTHECTPAACPVDAGPPGSCQCRLGYAGVPLWNGTHWTHTCRQVPCPPNAAGPGCNCTAGYTPVPLWGWSGSAGQWIHTCRVAVCRRGLPFGYAAAGGSGCTTSVACGAVTCAPGYLTTETPALTCNADDAFLVGRGCVVVDCPPGGDPARGCACGVGYVGSPPSWVGGQWAHTCTAVDCPPYSGPNGTHPCACLPGYLGTAAWTGNSWSHVCTPVACPSGASPPGECNCPTGQAPTPSKQWTGRGWNFSCVVVPCPTGTTGVGLCTCAVGYTGTPTWSGSAWTHTCTPAACPTGAAGTGCVCTGGFLGTPQWSAPQQAWVHTCSPVDCPANAEPPGCTCREGYLGTPVWSGTLWTHTCSPAPCPQGASGEGCPCGGVLVGTPLWDSTLMRWAHYCADPAVACPANSAPPGVCACLAGYQGQPLWTGSAWGHTCTFIGGFTPTPTGGGGCGAPPCGGTCTLAVSGVSAPVGGGAVLVSPFATNLGAATVVCVPQQSSLFAITPTVGSAGELRWQPASQAGATNVECRATDVCGQATTFSFIATVTSGTAESLWLRLPLASQPSAFIPSTFRSAVRGVLRPSLQSSVSEVKIHWLCPASVCPGGVCPSSPAARLAAGCSDAAALAARARRADPQQVGSYVDFDVVTPSPEGSQARALERRQAAADISAALQAGGLTAVNPGGQQIILTHQTDTATPAPQGDSDDSMPWWLILIIVAGTLLLLTLLIIIIFCCCRKRKQNSSRALTRTTVPEDKSPPLYPPTPDRSGFTPPYPRDPHPTWGNSPGKPRYEPSPSPSSHASPASDSARSRGERSEVDVFEPGDEVTAQYIDGDWYRGTVWSFLPADDEYPHGAYTIKWYDGSISDGVPPQQMQRLGTPV
eukprot:Hpha_TRINITY_DN16775_c1_g5::TRINITY_DN16775_c1_g5_i1::g.76657::m.76657